MNVTLGQLIDALERARDDHGADAPVRIATQPGYPISHLISAVNVPDPDAPVVWIGAEQPGSWVDVNPYAPGEAFTDEYL